MFGTIKEKGRESGGAEDGLPAVWRTTARTGMAPVCQEGETTDDLFCAVQGAPAAPAAQTPPFSEELIARIGRGDREALRELYEKTARAVYAFALAQLRDPEGAQDVMQDTFLKIRAAAHLYRPMGKPMAWLFTIARNLAWTCLLYTSDAADD